MAKDLEVDHELWFWEQLPPPAYGFPVRKVTVYKDGHASTRFIASFKQPDNAKEYVNWKQNQSDDRYR